MRIEFTFIAGQIRTHHVFLFFLCALSWTMTTTAAPGGDSTDPARAEARIRYAVLKDAVTIRTTAECVVESSGARYRLNAGEWTFEASGIHPAAVRYHVFPKTFQPGEEQERDAFLASWRARGYTPEIETFGRLFMTQTGRRFDNREYWVSLSRYEREQEANALVQKLKEEPVWAWVRTERIQPGTCVFSIRGAGKRSTDKLSAPLTLQCAAPFEVVDISGGYWKEHKVNRLFQGPLSIEVGPAGELEVYGSLPVETYLRGVVPAEMPASWPLEALKAQAVVARSEIYASLAGKYRLEGFDFTALESCRAYAGLAGHTPRTDEAVAATEGMALVYREEFIKAVFSSCCGGWTENNENVWSGPPDPMLRGASDLRVLNNGASPSANLRGWLSSSPDAWCSGDATGFRWQKRYTIQELTKMVNQRHNVGTLTNIREGARGVSGRLKSITITGSAGSVTLDKELAIRQAFGGLPSAMVIIEPASGNAAAGYTFKGGGRGHGVGMCQHGARGMAAAGRGFEAIVARYFQGAAVERTQ